MPAEVLLEEQEPAPAQPPVYLDTSALAKWYLNEARSEEFADWIADQDDAWVSTLTLLEMRSLLARRRHAGELTADDERRVFSTLEGDLAEGWLLRCEVEDAHVVAAVSLCATVDGLRSLDALHLAIARSLGLVRLATADRAMAEGAEAAGFEVTSFAPAALSR